jgi:hypothetical protein
MIFKNLTIDEKNKLSTELTHYSKNIGGDNFFLTMIENIRESKPNPLLNKTAICHYKNGTLSWKKTIYKDTLTILFNGIRKEEKDGDILDGLNVKEYKQTMNMLKILKPIEITVNPKEEYEGFSFSILDTTEMKKTKISLIFKIIFFYNIEFAKEVLNHKVIDNTDIK